MTVGVVTAAVGHEYERFLPEWAEAVAALEVTPDRIVIVASPQFAPITLPIPVQWISAEGPAPRWGIAYMNQAIAACQTDWIAKIDVDDIPFPHMLNPLAESTADILSVGYSVDGTEVHAANVTADQIRSLDMNHLASCSPFRRALWVKHPYRDTLYADWAFWAECARSEAVIQRSGTIDYLYRIHPGQATAGADQSAAKNDLISLIGSTA